MHLLNYHKNQQLLAEKDTAKQAQNTATIKIFMILVSLIKLTLMNFTCYSIYIFIYVCVNFHLNNYLKILRHVYLIKTDRDTFL